MILTGEYIVAVAVPIVIAILAMAFPLILDASTKINSQYKSAYLAKIFQREPVFRGFVCSLILSLVSLLLYMLKIPVWKCFADCWLVCNSAVFLVYLSTFLLVVFLMLLSRVISTYYDQNKLLHRLVRRYKWRIKFLPVINFFRVALGQKKVDIDSRDFQSISKLMNFSIDNADETLARELFSFFVDSFAEYRNGKQGTEIIYPEEFYNSVFEANELLCSRKRKTISYYNDGTLYDLFLDAFGGTKLSQRTIRFLWMCVIQDVSYGKDDYVFALWKKIYQHVAIYLGDRIENQVEKAKFIELAHMMCSYMQFNHKYELLRRMMTYTQMSPPNYAITPSSMQMVVDACLLVREHNDIDSPQFLVYYESLYPQIGAEGVDAGQIIQDRLYDFYALAFLWQYIIQPAYPTRGYQDVINYKEDLKSKQKSLEVLQKLSARVEQVSMDNELMVAMDMKDINYNRAFGVHKSPKDWFESSIKSLMDSINVQNEKEERDASIPKELVSEFKEKVAQATQNMLKEVKTFTDESSTKTKTAHLDIGGRFDLQLKSHVLMSCNFIDVYGSLLATDCKSNIFAPLLHMKLSQFIMEEEDAISAALSWKKRKGLMIINFGVWLNEDYLKEKGLLRRDGERVFSKNGIEIFTVNQYPTYPELAHSFVIVNKADLPRLLINDIDSSLKEKYGLEECVPKSKVYASILDFHDSQWSSVRDHYVWKNSTEADKYALFCSVANIQLHYNTDAIVAQLRVYNQFTDKMEPQKPNNVVDIWRKSNK